jgi:sphingomyelin phosphodiesterase 2
LSEHLSIVSFNTRGIPVRSSGLATRYSLIAANLEGGDTDIACFQEVFSYWHLRLLARRMPSFRYVSYRPSPAGPAGGLATLSRLPLSGTLYRGFGIPPRVPGISWRHWLGAGLKGALVTRLANPAIRVINTHPAPNRDGDWSAANRFYPLHRAQLGTLTRVIRSVRAPAVVCGDFNVDRDSALFAQFLTGVGLADAFGGNCPATFHAEYLPAHKTPLCIDFILTSDGIRTEAATLLFPSKVPLPGGPGYVSDHVGLCARLFLLPSAAIGPATAPGRGVS